MVDDLGNPAFNAEEMSDEVKAFVLLEAYKVHAELLHNLTQIDLKLFGGFITIQIVTITSFLLV